MLTLQISARNDKSTEELRAAGMTPAVLYGPKQEPQSIVINAREMVRVWKEAGETTLVMLEGIDSPKETLIHDVQIHPLSGTIMHADFYVLEKGKKVEVTVPLHFVGESPAEKSGYLVNKALHEIDIEVSPSELPHHLEVDITALATLEDQITAGQIVLPKSAELKTDIDELVASVAEIKEEVVEEPVSAQEGEASASDTSTEQASG